MAMNLRARGRKKVPANLSSVPDVYAEASAHHARDTGGVFYECIFRCRLSHLPLLTLTQIPTYKVMPLPQDEQGKQTKLLAKRLRPDPEPDTKDQ